MKDSPKESWLPTLLQALVQLLEAHRPAFKQCWNSRSAVVAVQWSVWVYAILVLAGYRTWGLCGGPPTPAPWWPGAKRWSFNTLWRSYRAALWGTAEFRPLWLSTGDNWWKKETWLAGLANSVAASVGI